MDETTNDSNVATIPVPPVPEPDDGLVTIPVPVSKESSMDPDLIKIMTARSAQISLDSAAADMASVHRMRAAAENQQNMLQSFLLMDNRFVTAAVAAGVLTATEPDNVAGLNTAIRTPLTVDQPGNMFATTAPKAT